MTAAAGFDKVASMGADPNQLPGTRAHPGGLSSCIERETKLSVDEEFRLPPLPGKPLPPRLLTSTYYDTADFRLARGRITLRRRVEQGKGLWQMKLPFEDGRRELEIPGPPGVLPPVLRELLIAHLRGKNVRPVATLRMRRTGVRARGPAGPVADVVLDVVTVIKDGRVVNRFRELELEWRITDQALMDHLEQTLRKAGATDHDGRPKLFQALGRPPRSHPPPKPNAPIAAHLAFILAQRLKALLARDPGTRLGGEPEDLHQMRVATRRLRSVLRVARPLLDPKWTEPLRAELDWLGQLLGPARDLDVQIAYFTEEAATLKSRDRQPLERFIHQLQRERAAAQHKLLEGLRSPRYLKLIDALVQATRALPVVVSDLTLDRLAAEQFTRLRKTMKRLKRSPSDEELHELRIKTKRARYAAELAKVSVGKPAARFAKRAMQFQDLLGAHQDAVLAENYIRAFVAKATGLRAAFVAGRMVERQRQRRQAARASLAAHWKKLKRQGKKVWSAA